MLLSHGMRTAWPRPGIACISAVHTTWQSRGKKTLAEKKCRILHVAAGTHPIHSTSQSLWRAVFGVGMQYALRASKLNEGKKSGKRRQTRGRESEQIPYAECYAFVTPENRRHEASAANRKKPRITSMSWTLSSNYIYVKLTTSNKRDNKNKKLCKQFAALFNSKI